MRRTALVPLVVGVIAGVGLLSAAARTTLRGDLGDFQVPLLKEEPDRLRQVHDPAAAKIETIPGSKLEVVKAASTQDAINFAVNGILSALQSISPGDKPKAQGNPPPSANENGNPPPQQQHPTSEPPKSGDPGQLSGMHEIEGGVKLIEAGSGYGIVGVGNAYYDTKRENPNLVLEDQRRAWMEADLKARSEVARFLNEVDIKGRQEITSKLSLANTDTFSGANLDTSATEDYAAAVNAMVTGLVTYDVLDDPNSGQVRVSVVSTPKTRGEVRTLGSRAVFAGSIEEGMQQIMNQLALNVVPPVGAKIITVPSTGETVWVGFGAEVVQIHDNPKVAGAIRDAALKTAEMRAQAALVALIRGQKIESKSEFSNRYDEMSHEFDRIVDQSGKVMIQGKDVGKSSTLSDKLQTSTTATSVNGKTPAGTMLRPFEKPGSRWVYMLAIYAESIPALLRGGPTSGPPPAQPTAPTPPPQQQPAPPPTAEGPCPPGSLDEGVMRLTSVGTGRNKAEAVQNALLYAVKQVNESRVNADIVMKKKFSDALEDVDGKLKQNLSVNTDIGENVNSVSNGLVKGYRVLYEGGLRPLVTPNSQGDQYEIDLCVDIPQFDPNRPRPGQRSTIAFLGLHSGRDTFEIGGENVAAADPANEFANEVVTFLTSEKRFTVIDREYLKQWKGEIEMIKQGVDRGDMSLEELRNVGHMLSADYVLVGTLQDVSFKQWQEYVPIRKRNEARALLNINVHLRMIKTATGEIIFSDGFNRTWGLPEIDQLLQSYGNMDRSLMASKEAAQSLLPRILAEVAKESAIQAKIRVMKIAPNEILLANDDQSVREGDELSVFKTEKIQFEGKSYDSETEIARLGIVRVQGAVAYARLIQGNLSDVAIGATCRRVQ